MLSLWLLNLAQYYWIIMEVPIVEPERDQEVKDLPTKINLWNLAKADTITFARGELDPTSSEHFGGY